MRKYILYFIFIFITKRAVAQSTGKQVHNNNNRKIHIRALLRITITKNITTGHRYLISNTHHSEHRFITRVIDGAKRNENWVSWSGVEARDFKIKLT